MSAYDFAAGGGPMYTPWYEAWPAPLPAAQHTPGPWHSDRRDIFAARGVGAPGALPVVLAQVWSGGCSTLAEADANERLIAAAPELFDELRRLVALLRENTFEGFVYQAPSVEAAERVLEKVTRGVAR